MQFSNLAVLLLSAAGAASAMTYPTSKPTLTEVIPSYTMVPTVIVTGGITITVSTPVMVGTGGAGGSHNAAPACVQTPGPVVRGLVVAAGVAAALL